MSATLPPISSIPPDTSAKSNSRPSSSASKSSQLPQIRSKNDSGSNANSPVERAEQDDEPRESNSPTDEQEAANQSTIEFNEKDFEDDQSQGSQTRPESAQNPSDLSEGLQHTGEIEDPEEFYWRTHQVVPKNSKTSAKEILKRVQTASGTKKLEIGDLDLRMIPDKIFELDYLKTLWAHNNKIEVIPSALGDLKNLTQLRIYGNRLTWLPEELGQCLALQTLWVQDNQLIALPASIGKLTQLKILVVARNPLRSFPAELQECESLKDIDAEGLQDTIAVPPMEVVRQGVQSIFLYLREYRRRLSWIEETNTIDLSSMGITASTLPLEITNMTSVTVLNLSGNRMASLTPSIRYMGSLTQLDVSNCLSLKRLCPEAGSMSSLTDIVLAGTELESPPPQIVQLGSKSISAYLSFLLEARVSKAVHFNEIDLLSVDLAILDIQGLTLLDLSSNRIRELPEEVSQLDKLQSLYLQSNDIVRLPRALESCTALTDVNLSDNRLEGPFFADLWISAWVRLRRLNIKSNDKISRLPMTMAYWTALEKLEIDVENFLQPPVEVLRKGAKAACVYCSKFSDVDGAVDKLELSGYKFQSFPMEICQLKRLKVLQLQHNTIQVLPQQITVLRDLQELHLSHNPLMVLSDILQNLGQLRVLRLDNTLIDEIPAFIGKLHKLRSISAVQNRLTSLPDQLCQLTSLTKINFDSNSLHVLPEAIGKLKNLKELSVTKNKIGWIPSSIGNLHSIEELRFSFNRLQRIPQEIGRCQTLVRLRCSHNLISQLPLELELLTNLEDLSFNSNQVSILPLSLGNLAKLRNINYEGNPLKSPQQDVLSQGNDGVILYFHKMYNSALSHGLEMSNSHIRYFPAETLTIPKLHSLVLDDNEIETLPAEVMVLSSLTFLSLQRNRLRSMPPESGALPALCKLYLNGNCLSEIPLTLGICTSLQDIDLSGNEQVWSTPPQEIVEQGTSIILNYLWQFGYARSSRFLKLEGLKLEKFPSDVFKYHSHFLCLRADPLTGVSISHNKIAEIPADISQLADSLCHLNLDENEIEVLPDELGALTNLQTLSFERNFVSVFPQQISTCTGLQTLQLRSNPITSLHPSIGALSQLTVLLFDEEGVQEPSLEILQQGCSTIIRYLEQVNLALQTFHLNLPCFKLFSFPPELVSSPSRPVPQQGRLISVCLAGNQLETLPPSMGALTAMTRLDLSKNKLSRTSAVMGAWQRLEFLDLSGNSINELPSTIGNMRHLKVLNLSDNLLSALPPYMAKLVNLRELYLHGNKLEVLYAGIDKCSSLSTLSLSNNCFPSLPYSLSKIPTLNKLVVDNNPLVSPPPEVLRPGAGSILKYLGRFEDCLQTRRLDLSGMELNTFPLEVVNLESLTVLDLRHNHLETLPPEIAQLIGLEILHLDHNNLLFLPLELGSLYTIRELTFAGNEVRSPPVEVLDRGTSSILEYLKRMQDGRKTQRLDLRNLELRRMPVEVAFMTGLTSLSLSSNHLQKLFVGIGQLSFLTEMFLDYNELASIPRSVSFLTNLTVLSLSHNKIRRIEEWLHPHMPLVRLNLCDNAMKELHPILLRFSLLQELDISMNPLDDPPHEINSQGKKKIFQYLSAVHQAKSKLSLDLNDLALLKFPLQHCQLTMVKSLSLDDNCLEELPEELSKMVNLERFSAVNNRLTFLPLTFGHLKHLTHLDLSGNDMVTPPQEVCSAGAQQVVRFLSNILNADRTLVIDLKSMSLTSIPKIVLERVQITSLDLSTNRIAELPRSLLGLTCLKELIMDDNELRELPSDLGLLRNLVSLSLRKNALASLPPSVSAFEKLSVLNVEDNQIRELPPELGAVISLHDVRVRGNPLVVPPAEVVKRGVKNFLNYLRRIFDLQQHDICDISESGLEDPKLPEYILRQSSLKSLQLHHNSLRTLDISLTALSNLTLVNLDHNQLVDVPECIFFLLSLETLRVAHNELREIDSAISRLTGLKLLSLDENRTLEFLPPSLGLLTSLEQCEVKNCPLRSPPISVVHLGTQKLLKYLLNVHSSQQSGDLCLDGFDMFFNDPDLFDPQVLAFEELHAISVRQNRLKDLDPLLAATFTSLVELDLSSNFLRQLPDTLSLLSILKILRVDQNELREVQPWISSLASLQVFSASHNQLEFLAETVGDLSSLETFDLKGNKLIAIPPEISNIPTLTSLLLQDNPIRSPPPEICEKGFGSIMDYLRRLFAGMQTCKLQLTSMMLTKFPIEAQLYHDLTTIDVGDNLIDNLDKSIGNHPSLQNLLIAHNRLKDIHPNIYKLVDLRKLHLPFNQLSSLPQTLSDLRNLEYLNLVENSFSEISPTICRITSLTDLRISHNQLQEISPNVGQLLLLQRLNLENNNLVALPDLFGNMYNITFLNLSTNLLEQLPETFWNFTHLTVLDISNNKLNMLPTGLGMCDKLKNFEFHDNPFGSIPQEIEAAGAGVLLRYLKQLFIASPPPGMEDVPGIWEGKSNKLILEGFHLLQIPAYALRMSYINHLSVRRNDISEIPPEISLLHRLKHLDVESNLLRRLPLELCLCPLEELNLSLNNLEDPPIEVRDKGCQIVLKYLGAQYHGKRTGILDMKSCYMSSLPVAIQQLAGPSMHTMDLSDNLMQELPNLRDLSFTRDLRLGSNKLTSLPESIRLLTNLTSLLLPSNFLSSLPFTFAYLTNLTALNLRANKFVNIPASVCTLTTITSLDFSENNILVLDSDIGKLENLKELLLSDNGLQAIADEVCDLYQLTELDVSNNNLSLLPGHVCSPDNMEKLTNLKSLDIRGNLISVLPSGLGLLSSNLKVFLYDDYELSELPAEMLNEGSDALLKYLQICHTTLKTKCLDLAGMNLHVVPAHIGQMAHLEELRLGSNPILHLPDWIGNLRALRVLRLDKTGLQSLPFGLADCASLQMLDLDDVVLLSPPKQILSKGVAIVKEWLGRLREARGGGR